MSQTPSPSHPLASLRAPFVAWAVLVLALIGVFGWQISQGLRVDSNVLSLLPATEKDPVLEGAIRRLSEDIGHRIVFLFGAPTLRQAKQAAQTHLQVLERSGLYEAIERHIPQHRQQAFFRYYLPHRMQLLHPAQQQKLRTPQGAKARLQEVLQILHGPMSASVSGLLTRDPLLLLPKYLQGLPAPPGQLRLEGDVMVARAKRQIYVFAMATTWLSPFSRASQKAQAQILTLASRAMHRKVPEARLLSTGAIYFAQAGGASAEREISTIGVGSLLGILCLLLMIFRSPRQLLLANLPLGIGFVAAWSTCIALFGKIHLLTLVFGASLIGVCIDYAFHYFCEQRLADEGWTPQAGVRHILPGVTLGALTSIVGYLGLGLAPFPGLRQMAVFSSVGLLAAYGTVLCCFPLLGGPWKQHPSPWLLRPARSLVCFWQGHRRQWPGKLVFAALILFGVTGIWQLQPNDDVRLLLHAPADLVKTDRKVKQLLGSYDSNRFFLVEAASKELVLQRLEQLTEQLQRHIQQKHLGFCQSLAPFVPSQRRQRANKTLLQKQFGGNMGLLAAHMQHLGFAQEAQEKALASLGLDIEPGLDIDSWLKDEASASLRHLWLGATSRGYASIILLGGVTHEAAMQSLERPAAGIHYINKVDDISTLMRRYRRIASLLVALAYALIGLLVVWRYGLGHGALVLLPPLLAALGALGGIGWLGQPLQLFHLLALLIVLGIGIDYTIFFAEATKRWQGTLLAIVLSAITTLLSFGLLALSQTPLLRAFGATILIGISIALLLSPMAISTQASDGDATDQGT